MKKILQPVDAPVTQYFGNNFIHNGIWAYKSPPGHPGIDYGCMDGSKIKSCDKGQIINTSDRKDGYGNLVIILHDWGVSLYGHNKSFKVSVGDIVGAGDIISLSDNTGFSTGPHLHFEIQINGKAIDPLPFLTININEVTKVDKERIRKAILSTVRREPDDFDYAKYQNYVSIEDLWYDIAESKEHLDMLKPCEYEEVPRLYIRKK